MTKKTKSPPRYDIVLGGRTFAVPQLPIRFNREVYPMCWALMNAEGVKNVGETGRIELTGPEMDDLARVAFLCAQVAEPEFTQDEFDNLPITPIELIDAFFEIRFATGAWVRTPAAAA